jgi:hypothetical protein
MIHEWPSHAAPDDPARPAPRLSRAQKWDLARMAAACFLSLVALGTVVWVVVCQDDRIPPGRANVHLGTPPAAVTVQVTDVVAPETTPQLEAARVEPSAAPGLRAAGRTAARPSATARRTAASPEPESLPRRVGRFITGDGRHEVRPFPTVPER